MTAFTPDDLDQIQAFAKHLDCVAPGIYPSGTPGVRLPIEVRVLDNHDEVAVKIHVPSEGDPTITFPSTPEDQK